MRTRELLKLNVGDRVSVTGTMDGMVFANATGVVTAEPSGIYKKVERVVKFDTWNKGWSMDDEVGDHCWAFSTSECLKFNITRVASRGKA